jgi:NADH:ubiquinone oxidoreductase subunit F (NADH-binding)
VQLLEQALAEGKALDWQTIEALEALLVETSICGLGYVVLNPLISAAKHWPEEIPGALREGASTDGEGIA